VVPQAAGGCLSQLEPLTTDNGRVIGIHFALADARGLASNRVEMYLSQSPFPENSSDFPQSLLTKRLKEGRQDTVSIMVLF